MSAFIEPQSKEQALERLSNLKNEVVRLQNSLSDRDVRNENGSRMNEREWWAWKKKATEQYQDKLCELRELKAWMSLNDKKINRQVRFETSVIHEAYAKMKENMKIVFSEIFGMRERIKELTAENNALHKRLQELELENKNAAPDHRREGWRQDDNQDTKIKS